MANVETFLSGVIFAIFFSPSARFFRYLFLGRVLLFTTLEVLKPARDVSYRSVALGDLFTWAGYTYLISPLAYYLSRFFPGYYHPYPASVMALPLWVKLPMAFVLVDFGLYWVHRLLHTRYLWAAHKWHHQPTRMYWLVGWRATLPQQILANIPFVLGFAPLYRSSPWLALAVGIFYALQLDWMHMNVTWRSHWLEWFVVTPRYHHIHHSDDPRYSGTNSAATFTVWDRLFGTYVDPDAATLELTFGIAGKENPLRVVLGV